MEKAILVTVDFKSMRRDWSAAEASEELVELSRSSGLEVEDNLVWNQKVPNAPFLIGKGKAEELGRLVEKKQAGVVVFDADLTPSQQRNLEELVQTKTIDRTQLILDIFAQRARSMEGKLQVELAQLKYLLPRLGGKGIYLSRLGGGVGTRGPGEQKLEVDRRRIREKITRLSRDLVLLEKRRLAGIVRKKEKNLPLVAIVGYTNAGKTTFFNAMTRSVNVVKNQLFSTLDTTTRLLKLPGNRKALLVDTVGFIRDLPHHLIESFKATLEEAVHADLLLHVIDSSRGDTGLPEKAVNQVLQDLGVFGKRKILVFNKADKLDRAARESFFHLNGKDRILISALTGEGLKQLSSLMAGSLSSERFTKVFYIPREKLGLAGYLYKEAEILGRRDKPEGSYLKVSISPDTEAKFKARLGGS